MTYLTSRIRAVVHGGAAPQFVKQFIFHSWFTIPRRCTLYANIFVKIPLDQSYTLGKLVKLVQHLLHTSILLHRLLLVEPASGGRRVLQEVQLLNIINNPIAGMLPVRLAMHME